MFFETAQIETAIWIPPLFAFFISFFGSMGGVSGAFLLLPFQMSFLNYTNPSVSATNQLFNIVAIPSGVYRYWKEGRMVWPLTWMIVSGTLPGVFIGVFIRITYLPDPKNFKVFAGCVLFYLGVKLISDLIKTQKNNADEKQFKPDKNPDSFKVEILKFNLKGLEYSFLGNTYKVYFHVMFPLSLVVGVLGGIYGIGGGVFLSTLLVTFFKLPVYTIAGATLMGTFITSIAGVAFYQLFAPFYPDLIVAPDWMLGILFGIGGILGMYLGAKFQKFVPSNFIKWVLAGVLIFSGTKYLLNIIG